MSWSTLMASKLTPTMARAVLQCRRLPVHRLMSSSPPSRPFKVHVGASFAGKPPEYRPMTGRRRRPVIDFPADSDITSWRAHMLSRPKGVPAKTAGEDFYYVQEVSADSLTSGSLLTAVDRCAINLSVLRCQFPHAHYLFEKQLREFHSVLQTA